MPLKTRLINKHILRRFYSTESSSKKWKSVVGLEVHAQISTESKLFSGASTKFSSPINTNASLFDIATPGTLPVLNRGCVEAGILTALSLNCQISPVSYFDRKHYFYADMPAGYQITQQRAPLALNGGLDFYTYTPGVHKEPYKSSVRIKQLQLEQDSGKSLHDSDRSLVDLNRAGVPLMELVFEPDLVDGEEAAALIKELITILQRIGTCSCKMEGTLTASSVVFEQSSLDCDNFDIDRKCHFVEGALRVDANVSIHREGEALGTRTEIKNIGSVRGVAGAIKYEIARQIKIKESQGTVVNETRSWNQEKKTTVPMRDKEVQQDYRYMPEPNLPPLHVALGPVFGGLVSVEEVKVKIPELPEQTRTRLREQYGLSHKQCVILVSDFTTLQLFEGALLGRTINPVTLANFLINELNKLLNELKLDTEQITTPPSHIGDLIELLQNGIINRGVATQVLKLFLRGEQRSPGQIVKDNNWQQITDEQKLRELCTQVLEENEKGVKQYLDGKSKVFGAFMGAVFKKSETRADMKKCEGILKELLAQRLEK